MYKAAPTDKQYCGCGCSVESGPLDSTVHTTGHMFVTSPFPHTNKTIRDIQKPFVLNNPLLKNLFREISHVSVEVRADDGVVSIGKRIHEVLHIQLMGFDEKCADCIFTLAGMKQKKYFPAL